MGTQWACPALPLVFLRQSVIKINSPARSYFGLLIQRSRQRLLNAAAWTGLEPAPESRSRGAHPHLSRSLSTRSVVHFELSFRVLLQHALNGWPMRSPTDASPTSSRVPTHGSGPMRIATPSPWGTFTSYSLPVLTGAPKSADFSMICIVLTISLPPNITEAQIVPTRRRPI
jgi:hypothetical protein